jgi:hypothetical protein
MILSAITAAVLPWMLAAGCRFVMLGLFGSANALGFWPSLTSSSAGCFVMLIAAGPRIISVLCAADFAIGVYFWRDRHGKRKRALRQAGAKARALLASLVRRVRESGTPRPARSRAPRTAAVCTASHGPAPAA